MTNAEIPSGAEAIAPWLVDRDADDGVAAQTAAILEMMKEGNAT